ncbi:zinc finger CCCH domain-containing protein 3-like isoform X1 [Sinocyclocheilus rhinocerous]|uniref:Zinc finger CCCH domain-containing protein 3 n=1 Tax=Sinocyclocheilus rhinocerous TaxID=307959 RepID=A0A673MLF3_9TELE|nr:PREDICTED: zinc finger CCCH domain-containing protein 3-like isoform X1 [Sinocyclocheilus rhinocerous]
MADREALKREIEELQNLINDYKSTHGDVPSSSTQWGRARHGSRRGRGQSRGHASYYTQSYSSLPEPYAPHSSGSWRKTYSLNNKSNRTVGCHVSHPAVDHLNQPHHHITTSGDAATGNSAGPFGNNSVLFKKLKAEQITDKSTTSSLNVQSETSKESKSEASEKRTVLIPSTGKNDHGCSSTSTLTDSASTSDPEMKIKHTLKSSSAVNNPSIPSSVKPSAPVQVKPHLSTAALSNSTVVMPTANRDCTMASSATSNLQSQASLSPTKLQLKLDSTQTCVASPCHKKSRFTWVKNQEMVNIKSTPKPVTSGSSPGTATVKRVSSSNKKVSRKPNLSLGAPKTSKYTWVSSSCSSSTAGKTNALTKTPRKPLSPKSLKVPVRTSQGGLEVPMKEKRCATTLTTLSKKSKATGASTSHADHASRYRWKAAGQSATANASSSISRTTHKGTVYQWTANKNGQKGEKVFALSSNPTYMNPTTTPLSAGAFKLRSRTKIIRRSASGPSLERRYSPIVQTLSSRYSLRRRTHTPVKSPTNTRRAQPKVLVSFGRHKLRRLSLTSTSLGTSRSGPLSLSLRSPESHRVFKTRYKIDTRRAHTVHHNPALSYRVKRVHSARILLQNRLRTTSERDWRGRSMRWIGGALYRVSANKLSRTQTTCTPNSRPGEWYNPYVSSTGNQGRTSATRYVANRAVQKSLAIIRQARQKKQKAKQYCMYYNRFGKCNHGDSCPYIHDPDKVAVCTRFLRGTCKQTDGTCPFSHKVAKEKMPVCSYFLKGICNNSSCPYSHVYVSRKADVCKDFVRGYCPQGDKCKKKHTLVCPDFSSTGVCPRGSKCKLHHRQSSKRSGSNASFGPTKKARTRDILKSSEEVQAQSTESIQADEGSSCSGPEKLPSFISLSSSPDMSENPDTPKVPPAAGPQAKGKPLHIKPRFLYTTQTESLPKEG